MDLEKRAMLLNPTIRLPLLGERKDKIATQTVEMTHFVQHKRTKATKYLIDNGAKPAKAVIAGAQNLRAIIYAHSFAWMDSKLRLSTTKAYPALRSNWDHGVIRLNHCVEEYLTAYPSLQQQARHQLGNLYDAMQYPSVDELRSLYRVNLELWPFPKTGHFVAEIAQDAAKEAKRLMEDRVSEVINASVNDMVGRAEKVVLHFVDKLESFRRDEVSGKTIGIFRDSLVTNITNQAILIRKLNFMDDVAIETLAISLDRLARVTAEELRDNDNARTTKASEARNLLARLDSFRKRDTEVAEIMDSLADYY